VCLFFVLLLYLYLNFVGFLLIFKQSLNISKATKQKTKQHGKATQQKTNTVGRLVKSGL